MSSLSCIYNTFFPPIEVSNVKKASVPRKIEGILSCIGKYGWGGKGLLDAKLLIKPGYCDFLDFLYESRLIHFIRGYETSLGNSEFDSELKQGIRMINGDPEIFKENAWVPWAAVFENLHYDHEQQEILTRTSTQEWNYIYPSGLTPQSRYNRVEPVHKLDATEMNALGAHGARFFKGKNVLKKEDTAGYIQIFTEGANRLGQINHVGLRIITKNGDVYSLGFERPNKEAYKPLSKPFSLLAAYNVTIAARDFKEFRPFEVRRTTTIPVSEIQFNKALKKVQAYAKKPIRFHLNHQNCVTFASDILKTIDITVDAKTTSLTKMLYEVFIEDCPYLGPVIKKIVCVSAKIFKRIAKCTPKPIRFVVKIITFVPCAIFNLFKNSVLLMFGAGREGSPLPENLPKDTETEKTDNSNGLILFKRLFTNWTDLFKEGTVNIHLPYRIADWQKKQRSTDVVNKYNGPKYYIVPEGTALS